MLEGLHGHHDRASELKQQGALEAARDPHSKTTTEDAERTVLNEAKASGAHAMAFDPNASAEEKAKQARANLPPELQHRRQHQTAALVSDKDDGETAGYDLPPPTTAGAIVDTSSPETAAANAQTEKEAEWSQVGWAPRFGNPTEHDEEGTLLDHQTYLEGKLDEKFFGDWYHNTGVIIFACLTSWVIAVLGGGLAWVILVMLVCGTYYRTSLRRVRRNFRDDVHRELAKTRLETDTESLEWINSFLVKFWPIYAPVLCTTIVNSVDQVLSTSTPAFLDSMRLRFFTLGTKPPRLEHVRTYPKADDDIVLMDWKFSFTPNDIADLTARQIKNKVNPKVILEVRVGKAMISKGLDIIVEDMAFSGLMRVKMKLQLPFPHIEKIDICFLERPTIDYVCKPLGGETFGFDINFVPGLESFIMEQIHANLGPMMYAPNVFPIEIAKLLAGSPVDQAIGVLQITFHGAQGLKNSDKFAGTPDPYAVVSINGREPLGKTKTVQQNANPRWSETINVILTSLKDQLTLQVFDYNEFRKDKELGQATFALDQLEHEHEHENQHLEVMAAGRARGVVQADIRFFPVLEGAKLPDGSQEPPPESNTGIAKFTIESAKELDGSKSLIGQLNPYAVLLLNGKEVQTSKKLKKTNNPIWPDATKELMITDRKKAKLGLVIKDDRDLATDPIIGTYQIKLDDMIELMAKGQEWYNLAGVKTGKVKMLLQWKPVALSGALSSSGGYMTPIGVMRIHFMSAKGLKNVETMGKSDPYVRIMLSGVQKGRTVTVENNLNPEWDEVFYVPIHSNRERLILEVMDEQGIGKDRPLGSVEVATSDYVTLREETGEYEVHDNKTVHSTPLQLGPRSPPKGNLNYTASFFPTVNVIDPDDDEKEAAKPSLDTGAKTNGNGHTRSETAGTVSTIHTRTSSANGSVNLQKKLSENERQQEEALPPKIEPPKTRISPENLSNYECGLLVFKLIDGDMAMQGCHLEVLMDDNVYPAYTSAKTRSRQYTFNEVGDAMVRELDLSKITLRLVAEVDKKGDADETKHIKAKLTGETISIIRQALYNPTELILKDKEGRESKVTVSLKFLPIKMKLDPSESVNNQGNLRVDVLDAADLPSADRNGYSDPYCKFVLQGKEIYKSKVQKKTLHPAWNEFFEVPVRSRTAANFEVTVYDWDFGDKADFLGKAVINLDILEPFQKQEITLGLDGKSGTIRLAMLFKPDYVTRSRQGSSTMSGTFAMPGKIVGAPVKGVGKGAVLVGGGVAKGASFLGRGFNRKKDKAGPEDTFVSSEANGTPTNNQHGQTADSPTIPQSSGFTSPDRSGPNKELPATPQAQRRSRSFGTAGTGPGSPSAGHAEQGTATISIVSATGFPPGTKCEVHVLQDHAGSRGLKEVLKTKHIKTKTGDVNWEEEKHLETKKVSTTADQPFRLIVYDHETFGGSESLGEATFYIDDQGSGGEKTVSVGQGSVVVRSRFEPASLGHSTGGGGGGSSGGLAPDSASVISASTNRESPAAGNKEGGSRTSAFRRSLLSRRERSATPGS